MANVLDKHVMQRPTEDDLDEFDEQQFEEEFDDLFSEQRIEVQIQHEDVLQEFVKMPPLTDGVDRVPEGSVVPRADNRKFDTYNGHSIITNFYEGGRVQVVCSGCLMGAILSERKPKALHWLYGFYLSRPCDQNT